MQQEAAIVMLAYVIIASTFLVFGLVFFIIFMLKGFLEEINRFVKIVTIVYEADHEEDRTETGGLQNKGGSTRGS